MSKRAEIEFLARGTRKVLPMPEYGYVSTVATALMVGGKLPKGYVVWDNGSTNDYRLCEATWTLSEAQAEAASDLFGRYDAARGASFTMSLPAGSGFYPFGPDKGDAGSFTVRVTSFTAGKQLEEPYGHYQYSVSLCCTSYPSYGLPSQVSEGGLQIGSISGLRWPPDWPGSVSVNHVSTQVTRGGSAYSVDKITDSYESTLGMVCNQSKAAALINHLVGTVRDSTLTVTPPANTYLFGRDNEDSAYSCQWINPLIEIEHKSFDRFQFPVQLYMVAAA